MCHFGTLFIPLFSHFLLLLITLENIIQLCEPHSLKFLITTRVIDQWIIANITFRRYRQNTITNLARESFHVHRPQSQPLNRLNINSLLSQLPANQGDLQGLSNLPPFPPVIVPYTTFRGYWLPSLSLSNQQPPILYLGSVLMVLAAVLFGCSYLVHIDHEAPFSDHLDRLRGLGPLWHQTDGHPVPSRPTDARPGDRSVAQWYCRWLWTGLLDTGERDQEIIPEYSILTLFS